jgi:hypothetical protein
MDERRRLKEPMFGYDPNAMNKERGRAMDERKKPMSEFNSDGKEEKSFQSKSGLSPLRVIFNS